MEGGRDDRSRSAPLDMSPEDFRRHGHAVVDRIATYLEQLRELPVAPNEPVTSTRDLLGDHELPATSSPPEVALERAMSLLFEHSVFTAHPRFLAFITGSAAPLGALGDLIASSINPNVASWNTAGAASAFEAQAVRWVSELVGLPPPWNGVLVSGGTAANIVSLVVARRAKAGWDVRTQGTHEGGDLRIYASREAHPWLGRAVDLLGMGSRAIHWVETDAEHRLIPSALRASIRADRVAGHLPFFVVGTAGTVTLGTVDPIEELAGIAAEENLWFHVDGAYGGVAACSPEAPAELRALHLADSIAVDPHKWLYVPLDAGCVLVKDPTLLTATFTYEGSYFQYANQVTSDIPPPYREMSLQNSRGFRALKLWLCLRSSGREGYVRMISDDIRLARRFHEAVETEPDLEAMSTALSTTVFRYVPRDLAHDPSAASYLEKLNIEVMRRLLLGGYAYASLLKHHGVSGVRICVVNFRTQWSDLQGLISWCVRHGGEIDRELRGRD